MSKGEGNSKIIAKLFYLILQLFKLFLKGIGYLFKEFKKLFRFSITFKITVVYAFLFSLLLFLISGSVLGISSYFLRQQGEKNGSRYFLEIKEIISKEQQLEEELLIEIAEREEIEIVVEDEVGRILLSLGTTEVPEGMLFMKEPLLLRDMITVGEKEYSIEIIKYLKTEETYLTLLFSSLWVLNTIAILIVLIWGSRASKKMLKPIEKMTKTAKHISIHQLNTRLDVGDSQDELKELAETFNAMLDRIEASYQQQNQFVSDASHELRTPISVLQGYANLLDRWGKEDQEILQESIEAIKSESENMKDLIEKLLFLARADKNLQKLEKTEFSMEALLQELVKEAKLVDSKHQFLCNIQKDCSFYGDRKSIKQLLRILLDNSVKFTPEGGKITLHLRRWKDFVVIEVEDTGVGIGKEDLPYIFKRFYCADKARSKGQGGHGLGLSIAKWIVENHHGRIEVKSAIGMGTKFTIILPILPCKG